jgi:hypothetical protein
MTTSVKKEHTEEYNNLIPSIKVECRIIPEYVLKTKKNIIFIKTIIEYRIGMSNVV